MAANGSPAIRADESSVCLRLPPCAPADHCYCHLRAEAAVGRGIYNLGAVARTVDTFSGPYLGVFQAAQISPHEHAPRMMRLAQR